VAYRYALPLSSFSPPLLAWRTSGPSYRRKGIAFSFRHFCLRLTDHAALGKGLKRLIFDNRAERLGMDCLSKGLPPRFSFLANSDGLGTSVRSHLNMDLFSNRSYSLLRERFPWGKFPLCWIASLEAWSPAQDECDLIFEVLYPLGLPSPPHPQYVHLVGRLLTPSLVRSVPSHPLSVSVPCVTKEVAGLSQR